MKETSYGSTTATRKGYRDQLIYYYNLGVGKISEIAGVVITKKLIDTLEKRYKQLGGVLPVSHKEIVAKKGKKWKQL